MRSQPRRIEIVVSDVQRRASRLAERAQGSCGASRRAVDLVLIFKVGWREVPGRHGRPSWPSKGICGWVAWIRVRLGWLRQGAWELWLRLGTNAAGAVCVGGGGKIVWVGGFLVTLFLKGGDEALDYLYFEEIGKVCDCGVSTQRHKESLAGRNGDYRRTCHALLVDEYSAEFVFQIASSFNLLSLRVQIDPYRQRRITNILPSRNLNPVDPLIAHAQPSNLDLPA
jgi:hypothetical protein